MTPARVLQTAQGIFLLFDSDRPEDVTDLRRKCREQLRQTGVGIVRPALLTDAIIEPRTNGPITK